MSVEFEENNKVDDVVATITVQPKVTLVLDPNLADLFNIRGNQLVAARVFDFETGKTYTARMTCNDTATGSQLKLNIVVVLTNVNDNPPVFGQKLYHLDVTELSPVGTTVGRYAATDPDKPDQLFYTLTSESNNFRLESATNPDLVIARTLDYDNVKNIKLVLSAQDTPLSASNGISFTATTTIMVTVLDRDNRPPWFQPCTRQEIGVTVVCQSAGYTGEVVLNEPEPGVLPLEPGPLYAIDGDSGINEQLTYSFLSGNDERLFEINAASGNISMLKPAKTMDTINLEVLAIQKLNSHQFATTTVTIRVKVKSLHPPQFQKSQYRGVITSMGTRAMDGDKPLYIHATDQDFNELPNPHIVYSINGSRDFSIINGYIFMDKDLPPDTLTLRVVATDTSNGDSDTAQLMLQVKSGLTTTSLPLSTTNIMATTPIGESSTTDSKTTDYIVSTTNPIVTTESSISTTIPMIIPSGDYWPTDMAALGATLGVLLFVSLVVIGVLIYLMRKGKADWKKIYEVSVFRSALGRGSGGLKEGIQYVNEAFQNDEDGGSMGSSGPEGGMPRKEMEDFPLKQAIMRSSMPLHVLLPDDTNLPDSEKADSEKEVKPILTKERRLEEGYKAVWFKEDIDPNAKEEVVIIPHSREDDSYEEDEVQSSSNREEDKDEDEDEPANKIPGVSFDDADLDSGLGVKMGDPPEDSDDDEVLTSDL
ncbi:putative cadherin-related family member 5-like [Scophthalmus maximus]|uniref:Putative cadherin-related family member 5-like n=1 Tax=Scophthalmus maximus TaxID=52904 RepID=A0A2U9BUX7_SCOMX|nr:putative cadherin-related family member 5-like [Scophthalmus maximus]